MDKIDAIDHADLKILVDSSWEIVMVINDNDVQLLITMVYISLTVFHLNTINEKQTTFITWVNCTKIMVRMATGETHVQFLIIDCEFWQILHNHMWGLWLLIVGSDKTGGAPWEATDKIMATICKNSGNWWWTRTRQGQYYMKPVRRPLRLYMQTMTADGALWQYQGDTMRHHWEDYGNYIYSQWQLTGALYRHRRRVISLRSDLGGYMYIIWQLMLGCDKGGELECGGCDKIVVTTLTANCEIWQHNAIAQEACAIPAIVQIEYTWLHCTFTNTLAITPRHLS